MTSGTTPPAESRCGFDLGIQRCRVAVVCPRDRHPIFDRSWCASNDRGPYARDRILDVSARDGSFLWPRVTREVAMSAAR
jgi:hypothetical protein